MNGDTPDSGRFMVIESDVKRHDEDIRELKRQVKALEPCGDGIQRIEELIAEEVLPVIKTLSKWQIESDAQVRAAEKLAREPKSFWDSAWGARLWEIIRYVAVVVITLLVAMNQHVLGGK